MVEDVTVVRLYLTEKKSNLKALLKHLREQDHVRGVTVFRGIEGFGPSGVMHTSKLVDLSLDLPVVVEFFDVPERIEGILMYLDTVVEPGHIVTWSARLCLGEEQNRC